MRRDVVWQFRTLLLFNSFCWLGTASSRLNERCSRRVSSPSSSSSFFVCFGFVLHLCSKLMEPPPKESPLFFMFYQLIFHVSFYFFFFVWGVCVCVCMCVRARVRVCVCGCVWLCVSVAVCGCGCVCGCVCLWLCVWLYVAVAVCVSVCVFKRSRASVVTFTGHIQRRKKGKRKKRRRGLTKIMVQPEIKIKADRDAYN